MKSFFGLFIEFFGEFVDDDGWGMFGLDLFSRFFLIIGLYLVSFGINYYLKKKYSDM